MTSPKPGEVYWVDLGMAANTGRVEHHRLERRAGRFEPTVIDRVRKAIGWMLELENAAGEGSD
ncbi:MAG: hypothetical protein ACLQU3_23305 [Limisphaerales bacterium]